MQRDGVKNKAVRGVVWTTFERFGQLGVSFVSDIVLARLLMPEDYGAIGMLTIFMVIAQQFMDGGLGSALIQKNDTNQTDYSTVFFWNLGLSMILYCILFFASPIIANFFHTPIIQSVLRIQALILIISAFSIVQVNQLVKNFKFKKIAIVSLLSSVIAMVVTITMAKKGFGVWALVTQHLLVAFIPMLIYWFTSKWLPSLVFSFSSFKRLFSYGFYVFMTNVVTLGSNNVQGLMIGRFFNASTMGFYSKASALESVVASAISQTVEKVSFPLYSTLQYDNEILISTIRRLTQALSYITYPLMFLLILIAKPLIIFLYTEKWSDCTLYFQILCLAGLAQCLQSVNKQAVSAIGKSKQNFHWSFIKAVLCLGLLFVGFWLADVIGLLIGMVVYAWTAYLINAGLVSKYIGFKLLRQLKDILPVLLLCLISFLVSYHAIGFLHLGLYFDGILKAIVFALMYIGISTLCKMKGVIEVIAIARNILNRK